MQGSLFSILFFISLLQMSISQKMRSCVLRAVARDRRKYKVYLTASRGPREFMCASGTVFYPDKCVCGWPKGPRPTEPVRPVVPTRRPYIPVDRPVVPGLRPGTRPGTRPINPIITTTKGPCLTSPDADRNYYSQYIHGYGTQRRRCPIGTLYNDRDCCCCDLAPVTSIYCRPEVFLDFDRKPILDQGGTRIPIGNNGRVDSVANAGRFDGTGQLTVWMYSNIDFGQKLKISLRFYDFPGGSDEQVLVSNCMDSEFGAVEIALAPRNKEVIFRADTVASGPAEIRLPYKDQSWKNVTFVYDGIALRAKVDAEEKAISMKGHLDTRPGGFEIGKCNRRGYVGYIDDLTVHRCVDIDYVIGNGAGPLSPYDARNSNLDVAGPL